MAGNWMAAGMAALALAGCSVGTAPGGGDLSGSFDAAVGLQRAYQASRQQAERCLVGDGGYEVVSNLDQSASRGHLYVRPKLVEGEVARVELSAIDANRTRVQVSMWGKSIWNEGAMRAMHDAVVFGVPSCTTYMPTDKDSNKNSWFMQGK
ncbi:BPTD_2524 family lipoprotein [Bordetella genomosp. 13]|uniref:Lipoprotein n=1 Tax=Bordetella genomosp. 13 TaxID=463040 RepID=A0A1W6ZDR6_9BORD|nr:hypothetical protein [Bordetella genomosp. 13]ARP95459.1 hypothetical protein CAL15_14330 [Bordetella genomosp. 13]